MPLRHTGRSGLPDDRHRIRPVGDHLPCLRFEVGGHPGIGTEIQGQAADQRIQMQPDWARSVKFGVKHAGCQIRSAIIGMVSVIGRFVRHEQVDEIGIGKR